jgi:hypothetical protein
MGRIIKAVVVLGILGFLGLTGYAYLGDIAPDQVEVRKPVVLNTEPEQAEVSNPAVLLNAD